MQCIDIPYAYALQGTRYLSLSIYVKHIYGQSVWTKNVIRLTTYIAHRQYQISSKQVHTFQC